MMSVGDELCRNESVCVSSNFKKGNTFLTPFEGQDLTRTNFIHVLKLLRTKNLKFLKINKNFTKQL